MERKYLSETVRQIGEDVFKHSIRHLTEALVEDIEEEMLEDVDPYEMYANRIRLQVYKNLDKFSDRFADGYRVLLDEMKETHSEEE